MTTETTQQEQAAAVGESACSALLSAGYIGSTSADDDCSICSHVRQTREPTEEEMENIQPGYAGDFECNLHGCSVDPNGWCGNFDYFDK